MATGEEDRKAHMLKQQYVCTYGPTKVPLHLQSTFAPLRFLPQKHFAQEPREHWSPTVMHQEAIMLHAQPALRLMRFILSLRIGNVYHNDVVHPLDLHQLRELILRLHADEQRARALRGKQVVNRWAADANTYGGSVWLSRWGGGTRSVLLTTCPKERHKTVNRWAADANTGDGTVWVIRWGGDTRSVL